MNTKKRTRNYWKKSIQTNGGKNCKGKDIDNIIASGRKMKEDDEEQYFIFMKEMKSAKEAK